MTVYLIYKDDATQQPRLTELRKSNLKICAILDKVNVVVKATSFTLKHGS